MYVLRAIETGWNRRESLTGVWVLNSSQLTSIWVLNSFLIHVKKIDIGQSKPSKDNSRVRDTTPTGLISII